MTTEASWPIKESLELSTLECKDWVHVCDDVQEDDERCSPAPLHVLQQLLVVYI